MTKRYDALMERIKPVSYTHLGLAQGRGDLRREVAWRNQVDVVDPSLLQFQKDFREPAGADRLAWELSLIHI